MRFGKFTGTVSCLRFEFVQLSLMPFITASSRQHSNIIRKLIVKVHQNYSLLSVT